MDDNLSLKLTKKHGDDGLLVDDVWVETKAGLYARTYYCGGYDLRDPSRNRPMTACLVTDDECKLKIEPCRKKS